MLKTYVSRVAAGAVFSVAVAAGSLGLTATAASACSGSPKCNAGPPPVAAPTCPDPDCIRGVPPAAASVMAASVMECSEPKCLSGTQPAAAPGGRVSGWTGHGGALAWAAGGVNTATSAVSSLTGTAINCPPPHPSVTALTGGISDC